MAFNICKISILVFLTTVILSCNLNDSQFPNVKPLNSDAVKFSTSTDDDLVTRAAGFNSNAPRAINSMGVFAAFTENFWENTDLNNNFMSDLKVERANAAASWSYNVEHLWPGNGYLSFFAYAPHKSHSIYGSNVPTITQISGIPRLSYTIAEGHEKQVDLLIAKPILDQTKRDFVTLPFRHALTKIAFSACLTNPQVAGTNYRITEIKFDNIFNSGSIDMDGSNRVWSLTTSKASYSQTVANGGLNDVDLTSIYQSLTPVEGHLFLMPQQLSNDATVTVTYETVSDASPVPVVNAKTMQLNLAISRFNSGDAYNLMFSIDNVNSTSFIVAPTKWDDTDVKADIKNRILNVTRVEAYVYPGVATRIFFWSNQPKDSVYVRPYGNLDVSRFPTGMSYLVNDVFQNLSGVDTAVSSYSSHLVYPGFNGIATNTGEGYIDVLIKDYPDEPYFPKLTDGDQRHIWLNASGLSRSIKLNSVVRANLTTTPYVGTFHRWNETGERIVTWGFKGNWTAEIDNIGSFYTYVLIDNVPSPYMSSGQLYGAPEKEVGDPEIAKLGASSTQKISGKGRVYFRVGWKSRVPLRNQTRAARIKVTGDNIGGLGINHVYLYLRQGEEEEYLMTDYGDRSGVAKWSPFNLTVDGLRIGESVSVGTNRDNARFVQYPTQTGAIYAWGNSNLSARPKAYPPVGTISFESVTANKFWYFIQSEQESCPPGYRRPNRGSISSSVSSGIEEVSEINHSLFEKINYNVDVNESSNSLWGYYADGFFDRRRVENVEGEQFDLSKATAVEPLSTSVGYIGRLFYNPEGLLSRGGISVPCNSLFFPAGGYWSGTNMVMHGKEGQYWSSSAQNNGVSTLGWTLVVGSGIKAQTSLSASTSLGMSIRCVRDIGFTTDLIPDKEIVVPTSLTYTANSNNIDAIYVKKWIDLVAQDISSLNVGVNLRAKITFSGTVASTFGVVGLTNLLSSVQIASGSTVVLDFTRVIIPSGSVVEVSVDNSLWEYNTFNGASFSPGGSGRSVSISSATQVLNRGIILRKK